MNAWLHSLRYIAVATMGMAAGKTGEPLWLVAVGCMVAAGVIHSFTSPPSRRFR